MNEVLQERCRLFVKNAELIKSIFKWTNYSLNVVSSTVFTTIGKEVDVEKLKECEKILKDNTGIFSNFQGNIKVLLVCKMSLAEVPLDYFLEVKKIYELLDMFKWAEPTYKIMAAMTIYDHIDGTDYQYYAEQTHKIYEMMKKEHGFLTSSEDIPYAAMLAVSDLNVDELIDDMEKCFVQCKPTFRDSNSRQNLSHVLALSDKSADEKCQKASDIWKLLKKEGHRYGSGHEISILGSLASLDAPAEEIVGCIIGADDYLKSIKGFGNFSMGSNIRRMLAAFITMNYYESEIGTAQNSLLNSSFIIAIQAEICMMILTTAVIVSSTTN